VCLGSNYNGDVAVTRRDPGLPNSYIYNCVVKQELLKCFTRFGLQISKSLRRSTNLSLNRYKTRCTSGVVSVRLMHFAVEKCLWSVE